MSAGQHIRKRHHSFYKLRHGELAFDVVTEIPKIDDIVSYINLHWRLYYGQTLEEKYIEKFLGLRETLIRRLVQLPLSTSGQWTLDPADSDFITSDQQRQVASIIYMCKLSKTTTWDFPMICSNQKSKNGGRRVVATGMTTPKPWTQVMCLELVQHGESSSWVHNPVEISSTEMLCTDILKLGPGTSQQDSQVNWTFELKNNEIDFMCIEKSGNPFKKALDENTHKIWDQFVHWRSKYIPGSKIKIYTNWPSQIHNNFGAWNIVEIYSSQHMIDEIQGFGNRPGRLEKFAQAEHNTPQETVDHVLYVVDPRPIELGDLLIWANLESNVYIESQWKFLLYRREDFYNSTIIDTSYIMHKTQ